MTATRSKSASFSADLNTPLSKTPTPKSSSSSSTPKPATRVTRGKKTTDPNGRLAATPGKAVVVKDGFVESTLQLTKEGKIAHVAKKKSK